MEHNAIEKALLVLSSFAGGNRPIGTVELAERLGLNKTTVSRTMTTLKKHNFLDQNPKTKQYSLGPMVATLGKAVIQSLDGQISIIAQPYCDRLRDQVGETVHLEVLSGNHLYLAYAVRGPNPVSVAIDVGDIVYPNVHAGAKVIAAFSDPEQVDAWLKNDLPVYTAKSMTDPSRLRARYKEFHDQGLSIDDGEYDENIYALGAPVFNHNNQAVAAIVIVAPYMRKQDLERPHVIRALKESATLVSGRLLAPPK
jgi:DNA-binding IclR family transcriptional regulator